MSNKTNINLSIKRIFNLGNFNNIEIKIDSSDEIEFNSIEERRIKTDNLIKELSVQFNKSQVDVFGELGLEEINATFFSSKPKKENQSAKSIDIEEDVI